MRYCVAANSTAACADSGPRTRGRHLATRHIGQRQLLRHTSILTAIESPGKRTLGEHRTRGSVSPCSQLVGVEVEVAAGVSVDLFEGHVVAEEWIPSRREVHAAPQIYVGFAGESVLQRGDDPVELGAHAVAV